MTDTYSRFRRRRFLGLLAAAGSVPGGLTAWMSQALAAGSIGNAQGIARLEGEATVNGKAAKVGTPVQPGDRVVTGKGAQAVIIVQDDAFLMRGDTQVAFKGRGTLLTGMDIVSGRVLSVFSKKPVAIQAKDAAIGIRGTGAYIEVQADRVYFCLCYGEASIDGPNMPRKTVKTTHHEQPLFLLNDGTTLRAEPGPFLNHSDAELIMLEALVGREPPFGTVGTYPKN